MVVSQATSRIFALVNVKLPKVRSKSKACVMAGDPESPSLSIQPGSKRSEYDRVSLASFDLTSPLETAKAIVPRRNSTATPVICFLDRGTSLVVSPGSSFRIDGGLLGEAPLVSLIGVVAPLAGSQPASAYNEVSSAVMGADPASVDAELNGSIRMDGEWADVCMMMFHKRMLEMVGGQDRSC